RIQDRHAGAAIEGDDVACAGDPVANLVVVGAGVDEHADAVLPQPGGAGGVGADAVALDHVARTAGQEVDIGLETIGDDVPRARGGAAYHVVVAELDRDAIPRNSQGGAAGEVGADEVALHHIARSDPQEDADAAEARDDIACPGRRAANEFP